MGTTISESNHFIFVHVPKTAGISIASKVDGFRRNAWLDRKPVRSAINLLNIYTGSKIEARLGGRIIPEHAGLSDLIELDPSLDLSNYYKFAVVRNPWDRALSMYTYHVFHCRSRYLRPDYWSARGKDFATWLRDLRDKHEKGQVSSQFDLVQDPEHGDIGVDQVVRFENLSADFASVAERLNFQGEALPHLNKSRRKDYRVAYSNESREIVAEVFAADVESFGYRFDGNP